MFAVPDRKITVVTEKTCPDVRSGARDHFFLWPIARKPKWQDTVCVTMYSCLANSRWLQLFSDGV